MAFFTNEAADVVQHVSLPLETVGFVLVVIEVYWSRLADRIESFVDRRSKSMNELQTEDGVDIGKATIIVNLLGFPAMVMFSVFLIASLGDMLDDTVVLLGILWSLCVAVIVTATIITAVITFFPFVFHVLNRISNGKALGSLGLIFAFLGLLGEVYQIITLYVAP